MLFNLLRVLIFHSIIKNIGGAYCSIGGWKIEFYLELFQKMYISLYDTHLSFFISKMCAHLINQQNQKEKSISGIMEHTIKWEKKGTKQKGWK